MSRFLPGDTVVEKLRLNTRRDGACLRWTGAHTPRGYGQLAVGGKRISVHRLAYQTFVGPIPPGLEIDHLCGVRDCIELAHLEPVTHRENLRRSKNPVVDPVPRTHCIRGHRIPDALTGKARRCNECRSRPVKCPECAATLTLGHLRRHISNVHGGAS